MTLSWEWRPFAELDALAVYELMALRQAVFIVEQTCAYLDADGTDPDAYHLLGRLNGELVACIRAFPPGVASPDDMVIGRVVTGPQIRGQGLGRTLMREGVRRSRETYGPGPVKVGAQAHLRGFYESLGFEVCGPGYDEDGIPHLPMRLAP
jgi:ElaA protein